MAHEIFIEPELENLQDEIVAAEWFEICSQLGLDKQLSLADKSDEKKAPPYMFCDPKTQRVIATICPRIVDYRQYSASTIPIDVLAEIQKCEKHGWYSKIKIAYDDQSPDPFVIGYTKSDYEWNADRHLIARWGAELLPFEELERKAIERLKDVTNQQLELLLHQVQYGLKDVDAFIKQLLSGKEGLDVRFSINKA